MVILDVQAELQLELNLVVLTVEELVHELGTGTSTRALPLVSVINVKLGVLEGPSIINVRLG